MKLLPVIFILLLLPISLFSQNPIGPPGLYFADPSAKIWNDGKLYLYGSLDESTEYYCSHRHHILETSDMKNWKLHRDVFASSGKNDQVDYNDKLLFAPDVSFSRDSFYLYYCQPSNEEAEGVAAGTSPAGPFYHGKKMDPGKYQETEPSVFIDDDGQVYYIWGQFSLKMAKLKSNMREIDKSSLMTDIITEKEHHFHEGGYMTKRNGIYYLVYADISRGEKPTCIGYATSSNPFGPYKYRGVIIDNDECNPGNWNNHGSIAEFNDQWYVFYHRSTHGSKMMRKACVEPIEFLEDGSIPEVEMTSQGAGGPIPAKSRIQAEQACILHGNARISRFGESNEKLDSISDDDAAVYKYIEFSGKEKKMKIRLKPGSEVHYISVYLDKPWHQKIADFEVNGQEAQNVWKVISSDIKSVQGTHALYFKFYGENKKFPELDWFEFK